ncbi:hypothetical protein AUO95_01270 [Corynebacterium glutamicum]|nr:hypothetical protein AUO95_01270 [Corynebacterium glutamicum]
MPALSSSIIDPLWRQFSALIPPVINTHPLGCHRLRIADRIIFDKLIAVLVLGASCIKIFRFHMLSHHATHPPRRVDHCRDI